MKNTLMFLLVSLLLSLGLTACGGDGNYGGVTGDTGAYNGSGAYGNGTTGYSANNTAGYNGSGTAGYNGSVVNGTNRGTSGAASNNSLVDNTRNALDDAGNAVNRAANGF